MEALFSGFHVGDVGRGIMGGCRGRRFGHFVVSQACGASEVWVLLSELRHKEKPRKQMFTGYGGRRGGGTRSAQLLVWSLGRVVDVEGVVVSVSSPEYTRMKKSPVNASLQG
jgi:hypothetical protein